MSQTIELAKILLPATVALYAAYLLVKVFLAKELEARRLEARMKNSETILPIRLQAYERITLFLERIRPQNLLLRVNVLGHSAAELHRLLLREIQNEYAHNFAQQVYIGENTWDLIRRGKEELVECINEAAERLGNDRSGVELAEHIFKTLVERGREPVTAALSALKTEVQQLF